MERDDGQALHEGFYVAGWLVEPELNRMVKQGQTVHLEPKVMQVLVCLAEKPGKVILRAFLMERGWADTSPRHCWAR